MLDRPRLLQLSWAGLLLLVFGVLAVGVTQEWGWLAGLDDTTSTWVPGSDTTWASVLVGVEGVFSTWPMTAYTVVLAVFLWSKNHRRAAVFAVGVIIAARITTLALKSLFDRDRPSWRFSDYYGDGSFPSGHASSIAALAGVVIVLVVMLVRRRNVRILLESLALVVALVVAADRLLLGRHFLTDVVAGGLVGAFWVLVGLALYNPQPRSHAERSDPLPQALPSARRLAVVLNPIKVEDAETFRRTVTAMAREAGWREPRWYETTVEDSGTGQAEQAAVEGADLVIVCGGDGTVREVCAELAGTGIPVGIVPAGTGNLLARNLDIPLYIRAAIDVALTGQDRAIDMVHVRGDRIADDDAEETSEAADETASPGSTSFESHFLVMAGMGFDAAIMEGVNEDIKKRVGWLAYVISGLKSLMFPATKVEISIDGAEWTKHRARTVLVGNVGYLQAGMPLLPDASIDDGQLDVVVLYPRRFLSWIPLAVRVLARRRRTDDTINRMTGRTVSIRTGAPTPRQLDGDSIGAGRELHMECIHGRLLVRVPR
ncbi:diacylglycerol kinase family protein [Nocardioides sp. R-C-SC26]|uniref:diacylglycerol kinase family protein n=1 Tax=Nocardioides sp. R-C-SC26 TaxID=2870414 RepID=UPI001E485B62|nr:diacylglycerol kinase family protein [Nocardioides sp. R-C-SC26]